MFQLIRYSAVGVANTGFTFGLFVVFQLTISSFVGLQATYWLAAVIGIGNGFLWQRLLVWKNSKVAVSVVVRFFAVNLSVSAINSLLLELFVSRLTWEPIPAQFVITVTLVPLSFLVLKYWVFRKENKELAQESARPKRVDVFLTYYIDHVSGLSNMARDIAQFLAEKNWEVHVHCVGTSTQTSQIKGVNVHSYKRSFRLGRGSFSIRKYWEIAKMARFKTGLCHVHMPYPESFWLSLWLPRERKIVATYHCEVPFSRSRINVVARALDFSHWLLLRRCRAVSTTSDDYAAHARLSRILKDRGNRAIPVVAHPRSGFRAPSEKSGKVVLGFLGRLTSEKGIGTLLDAMKKLPDHFVLKLAGPEMPYSEKRGYNESDLRNLEEDGRIDVLGFIDDEEIESFLNSIDIFVFPSENSFEAMGIVQIEAISAGVPVVASDLPGVRMVVQKTGFGEVFPVGDANALAMKIQSVATAQFDREKAHQILATEFLHPVAVTKYESLLNDLLDNHPAE